MTKTVICVDSRPFAKFAFGQTRHHTKKGRTLRFAPTRHTERCLLTAYRTAFPPFEGVTSPLRFALPPFEGGGRGDVPLHSDTVYPA